MRLRRVVERVRARPRAVPTPRCGGTSPSTGPAPRATATTTSTTSGPTTTTTVAEPPVTPVQWTPCGALQCGTVAVPLDYDQPQLGTIQIALAMHPATDPAERIGSLVIDPGGPGVRG